MVPQGLTGRGKELRDVELSAEDYEATLNWMYDRQAELGDRIFFKPTDAPHYLRVIRQRRRCVILHGRFSPEFPGRSLLVAAGACPILVRVQCPPPSFFVTLSGPAQEPISGCISRCLSPT